MADIMTYRCELGRHITDLRQGRGLSQEALGYRVGISRTYMGYIEQGARTPSLDTLLGISEALDVRMPDLFDFDMPVTVEYDSSAREDPDQDNPRIITYQ